MCDYSEQYLQTSLELACFRVPKLKLSRFQPASLPLRACLRRSTIQWSGCTFGKPWCRDAVKRSIALQSQSSHRQKIILDFASSVIVISLRSLMPAPTLLRQRRLAVINTCQQNRLSRLFGLRRRSTPFQKGAGRLRPHVKAPSRLAPFHRFWGVNTDISPQQAGRLSTKSTTLKTRYAAPFLLYGLSPLKEFYSDFCKCFLRSRCRIRKPRVQNAVITALRLRVRFGYLLKAVNLS